MNAGKLWGAVWPVVRRWGARWLGLAAADGASRVGRRIDDELARRFPAGPPYVFGGPGDPGPLPPEPDDRGPLTAPDRERLPSPAEADAKLRLYATPSRGRSWVEDAMRAQSADDPSADAERPGGVPSVADEPSGRK